MKAESLAEQVAGIWIKIAAVITAVAWILVFGLGLLIDSKPFRDSLALQFDLRQLLYGLATYTPTNIACLCLISAFLGGCASRLVAEKAPEMVQELSKSDSYLYMTENPFSSMLRGMAVYFLYLAGTFITNDAPFATTTASQFAKAAGSVSLLAFAVGYDPTIFRNIISLASRMKKD